MSYQTSTGPLMANSHPGGYTGQDAYSDMLVTEEVKNMAIVRRLTPTECARLQGFPDNWGKISDEKLHSASAEYKMWGNGIALPCALYVMQGVVEALNEEDNNV